MLIILQSLWKRCGESDRSSDRVENSIVATLISGMKRTTPRLLQFRIAGLLVDARRHSGGSRVTQADRLQVFRILSPLMHVRAGKTGRVKALQIKMHQGSLQCTVSGK
jgi:hypothetical protein